MSNYNLTNQKISSSFQQVMQHDKDTSLVYDGTGSLITNLDVTSSYATTASYAVNSDNAISASHAVTASHALFSEEAENAEHADAVQFPVIAKETLTKGDPVYVSGYNNGEGKPEVLKADASDSSKMPVVGLAMVNASNNDHIFIAVAGNFSNVDTDTGLTTPAIGDTLYVASGGGYTNVKPTGTNLIQNIGVIGRVQSNNGEIVVSAIQRTNDLPNIQNGYAWVGDSNGVPQAVQTGSWDVQTDITQLNLFTASQETINSGYNTFTSSYYVDSASFDTRIDSIASSGSGADWNVNLTNIPAGLVSGSSQVDYPNISNIPSGIISSSEQFPSGVVSGSIQITNDSGILSSSVTDFNTFSSSVDARIIGSTIDTGSFATTGSNLFTGDQTIDATLIVSQSAGVTGSIIHFPVLSSQGDQGTAASRFYNPGGPSLFETSISGVDKFELQTVGLAEMQINSGTSMVLNPGTSGNGNLVSTKIMTQQDSAISGNGQKDSITIGSYTGANGTVYNTNIWGTQNYPGSGINNAFIIGKYDSSFQKVSELMVNEGQVQMQLGTGADTDYDKILLNDNGNGTSTILLKSDAISTNQPVTQTFPAPGTNGESQFVNVGNVDVSGLSYPIARQGFFDFPGSGQTYENYFGTEVYGSGYAYGAEQTINGKGIFSQVIPSGSGGAGDASFVRIYDNYNGTSNVEIGAPTGVINIPTHINFNGRITSGLQGASISNSTASFQMAGPQMAVVDLPSSGDTHFVLNSPSDGQVFNVLVKQTGTGTVSFPPNIKQPSGSAYVPSSGAGARDILTFATYDTNTTNEIYLVNANNLI